MEHEIKLSVKSWYDVRMAIIIPLLYSATTSGSLQAETAQSIQGTSPFFTYYGKDITDLDQLLNVRYTDVDGNVVFATPSQPVVVAMNTPYTDVKGLFIHDGVTHPLRDLLTATSPFTVNDHDGDADILLNDDATGSAMVYMTKNGYQINSLISGAFDEPCSEYAITTVLYPDTSGGSDDISAITKYGAPNQKNYANPTPPTYTRTYNITIADAKFCYTKPRGYIFESLGRPVGPEFTFNKGFSIPYLRGMTIDFPYTAFPGATLDFAISTPQSTAGDYACRTSASSWAITRDAESFPNLTFGKNCSVLYPKVRPTTDTEIELYAVSNPSVVLDTFKIPAPKKWFYWGDPNKIINPPSPLSATGHIPYNTLATGGGRYLAAESCGLPSSKNGFAVWDEAGTYFPTIADAYNNADYTSTDWLHWTPDAAGNWSSSGTVDFDKPAYRSAIPKNDKVLMSNWGDLSLYQNEYVIQTPGGSPVAFSEIWIGMASNKQLNFVIWHNGGVRSTFRVNEWLGDVVVPLCVAP